MEKILMLNKKLHIYTNNYIFIVSIVNESQFVGVCPLDFYIRGESLPLATNLRFSATPSSGLQSPARNA